MNSVGSLRLLLPLDQLAQPLDALVVLARPAPALFVLPMRGNALFGDAMHLLGADLDFEGNAAGSHYGSVQRLVQVRPRDRDEVLDAPGNGVPLVVNLPQGGVAVAHRIGDDADA